MVVVVNVGCTSNAFVRWIEFLGLDNCLAMIICNELCDCDGRAQVLLNELRELFGGGAAVLDAFGIDAFDDEEGIACVIGEGGSHTVSPVPATAHGTRVIYIGELSGQRGVVLGTLAKRRECVAALGDAKAQVPLKGIEVLSAQRQGVFEWLTPFAS